MKIALILTVLFLSQCSGRLDQPWKLAVLSCEQEATQAQRAACKKAQREGGRYNSPYAQKIAEHFSIDLKTLNANKNKSPHQQANDFYLAGLEEKKSGHTDTATRFFQKASRLDPSLTEASIELAYIYLDKGQPDRAWKAIELASNSDGDKARVQFLKAMIETSLGNEASAIESYKKTINYNPDYAPAYYNLGHLYKEKSDYQKARVAFQTAYDLWKNKLKFYPNYFEVHPEFKEPFEGTKSYLNK